MGTCDASGAVTLSTSRMIVADDEDNLLRVFDVDRGGAPLKSVDISGTLGVPLKGKKNPQYLEVDLEAATRDGDRAYWMTSHGRNSQGKRREERLRFVTTNVGESVEVIGSYNGLLADLLADTRYKQFDLESASELAPKTPGGLNIEGLTVAADSVLFIGFRSPVPGGRALIAPLLNVSELSASAPARFGEPLLLDLGGQGIRSLSSWRGTYLIVAGDVASGGTSHLWVWNGRDTPARVDLDLSRYNPEGFFTPEDRGEIMLLSDDGSVMIDSVQCKSVKDIGRRSFRGVWLRLL